jgi:hypothetical protein
VTVGDPVGDAGGVEEPFGPSHSHRPAITRTATTATPIITPTDIRSMPGNDLGDRGALGGVGVGACAVGAGGVGGVWAACAPTFSVPQFGHRQERVDGSMWNRFPHERQVPKTHPVPHDTQV